METMARESIWNTPVYALPPYIRAGGKFALFLILGPIMAIELVPRYRWRADPPLFALELLVMSTLFQVGFAWVFAYKIAGICRAVANTIRGEPARRWGALLWLMCILGAFIANSTVIRKIDRVWPEQVPTIDTTTPTG